MIRSHRKNPAYVGLCLLDGEYSSQWEAEAELVWLATRAAGVGSRSDRKLSHKHQEVG